MNLRLLLILCCIWLTGCATDAYQTNRPGQHRLGESETHLGMCYLIGRGVPQNDKQAFRHLLKAADAGDPLAQNEVAYLYATGRGVQRNEKEAMAYYQLAAFRGLASAQYNLGLMYQYGMGTPANRQKACDWFLKSAHAGFGPAHRAYQASCVAQA